MKPKILFGNPCKKFQSSSPIKVLNSSRANGVMEIRVKILPKSQSVQSLNNSKSTLLSPTSSDRSIGLSSTSSQGFNVNKYRTVQVSPDDFIEPVEDLAIPSTVEYVLHTKHQPTKSMSESFEKKTSYKPPRPQKVMNKQKVDERNAVISRILSIKTHK